MHTFFSARLVLALGFAASLAACSAPRLQVTPRISRLEFDGQVAAEASGATLVDNDVRDDLGLTETSSEFGARADLAFVGNTLTLAWQPSSFSGDGTLSGQLSKGGVTLPAGTNVATSLDLDMTSGVWTFDFVPSETVDLGIGLGVHLLDFHSTLRSTDVGTPGTIVLDEAIPVPVLAARAGVTFGDLDLSALASGLKYSQGSDDVTVFDVDLMARWRLVGLFDDRLAASLAAGWRRTDVELDYTDGNDHTAADVSLSGLYYGLSFGF